MSADDRTIFISRSGADAAFAGALGRILEAAGYRVTLQQWDFANKSFIDEMHRALAAGSRVVALLSPEYLTSEYCAAEWQHVLATDPLNRKSRLVVLRVTECVPDGLLSALAYWDLVPIRDNADLVRDVVLSALLSDRTDRVEVITAPYWRQTRTLLHPDIRPLTGFVGREHEFGELRSLLATRRLGGIIASTSVAGMGGVGKTTLGKEFAARHAADYAGVWLVDASSEITLTDGLIALGDHFIRGLAAAKDRTAAARKTLTFLSEAGFARPWLLLLDNVEGEETLRRWSGYPGIALLLTSRSRAWTADVGVIELDVWSLDEAVAYLRTHSGHPELDRTLAYHMVEALGRLPLALAHAAAFLKNNKVAAPADYLARLADHMALAPDSGDYPKSVFATFREAMLRIEARIPGSEAVVAFVSYLAAADIPAELLTRSATLYPSTLAASVADPRRLEEILGTLDQFNLVTFHPERRTFDMHRLVQAAARDAVDAAPWVDAAVRVISDAFPASDIGPGDPRNWASGGRLSPHALAALTHAERDGTQPHDQSYLLNNVALYLKSRGDYRTAESVYRASLRMTESFYGPNHPEVAIRLSNLGGLYHTTNRYAEAEVLMRKALAIDRAAYGERHENVAVRYGNLAALLGETGRSDEAYPLVLKAIEIDKATRGASHPLVGFRYGILGTIEHSRGRSTESLAAYQHALTITEGHYGSGHSEVGRLLSKMATVQASLGEHAEAADLLARALALMEAHLGREHPDLLGSLQSRAVALIDADLPQEAESLLRRALDITLRHYGERHTMTAVTLNNLASALLDQNRYQDAREFAENGLASAQTTLGAGHRLTAICHNTIGRVQLAEGDRVRAEASFRVSLRLLAAQSKSDPANGKVAQNLGELLMADGRAAEAVALLERAEPLLRKHLGITASRYRRLQSNLDRCRLILRPSSNEYRSPVSAAQIYPTWLSWLFRRGGS